MEAREILIKPIVTEKTNLGMSKGRYVFMVKREANRTEIKRAVEEIFKVTVTSVNTANIMGKPRRMGKYEGKRPDYKKAVITLAEGQRIKLFEGI
ncbi:MAG: 50S ribosomal protein L23 [Bacillota bacterium]|jgi:large subunit ribosomal protein L23|nr:50S ribosomal protein L23 [Bacillota bacterium]